MNVAIAQLNNQVAPCFEAARAFKIISIKDNQVISSKTISCQDGEGFRRVRLLHLHDVEILICNGIKDFYRHQLAANGINVIPNINDTIDQAVTRFMAKKMPIYQNDGSGLPEDYNVSHGDLVSWARELFETNGYKVTENISDETLLLDLIAEIKCPLCNKNVKVAVCCGGHTYRPDQEIKEFHHSIKSPYNVLVFIYKDSSVIAKSCSEYGIEYISPETINLINDNASKLYVPILLGPIEGHSQLNLRGIIS